MENLAVSEETLWVCDAVEQTVYCIDRATGEVQFSVLTPFESPTGIAIHKNAETGKEALYVAYASEGALYPG